jgi:hypothetical protein
MIFEDLFDECAGLRRAEAASVAQAGQARA